MIFRKNPPPVTLDEASYSRWLRAHRPDLPIFLGLGADEQERLAQLGDDYRTDSALCYSAAIRDPETVSRLADPDADAEIPTVERLVVEAAKRLGAGRSAPPRPTFGGLTERRAAAERDRKNAKGEGRQFMGRKPKAAT